MFRALVTSCDMFWGKPVFHVAKKFRGFYSKRRGAKVYTLEIKFICTKCQLWPSLCKSNWKNEHFLASLGNWISRYIYPSNFRSWTIDNPIQHACIS